MISRGRESLPPSAPPFSIQTMICRTTSGPALALLFALSYASAQEQDRFDGSAIVRTDQMEYIIPIICDDSVPVLGFQTEPSRVTREATGRSSQVNLRVRQWQDSTELVVTLDRYVAWVPMPEAQDAVLSMTIAMSPASVVRDGIPVTLTRDMWASGDRPEGIEVEIEANCQSRDPTAPASRRL